MAIIFPCSVRNVKSAQNQFPVITQAERMVDRTGEPVEEMIAEERESSSAQIRTMLNEQRRTIIAENWEKVSHQELLAAQAEQERIILQGVDFLDFANCLGQSCSTKAKRFSRPPQARPPQTRPPQAIPTCARPTEARLCVVVCCGVLWCFVVCCACACVCVVLCVGCVLGVWAVCVQTLEPQTPNPKP